MDPSPSVPGSDDGVSLLLDGVEADEELESVHRAVGELFGARRTSRGLLVLAASAFTACGASAADPLVFDELEQRYLPE